METKTDILNELTSISPLIAGLNKVNVFAVPQGYFESIIKTVLVCLKEEHNILNLMGNEQLPDAPEGYFDHLATSILDKVKATESATGEIRHLSALLYSVQNKNVYEVPEGYFEGLNSIITDKVKTAGIKEELKEISTLLCGIQSKAVFEIPDGYFANLPDNILKSVHPPLGKVVSISRRSLFIKYAVAAMMTGVLALGLYQYLDKTGSDIPINNLIVTLDASIEAGKNMNDNQFNEALENLTETDIAKYLEKNGDITDVAVLRNNLDTGNLPSQEDYLLDETTLDNYLKEIEKTTLNN